MKQNILIANTTIFLSVAIGHLMRLFYQWPVEVAGVSLGLKLSLGAVLVMAILAWFNWHLLGKKNKTVWLKLLSALLIVDATVVFSSWLMSLTYWRIPLDALPIIGLGEVALIACLCFYLCRGK